MARERLRTPTETLLGAAARTPDARLVRRAAVPRHLNTNRVALGLAPSLLASGPDRSRNHPAVCQLEFAAQAIGVASHGRTKSPLGFLDFDTSVEREGGATRCRPLEAHVAAAGAWFVPPVAFE